MIGLGQNDKIIFSSGDTIYGKVIEVGVNDITYQHKNETTNNISKKIDIAKVIYSSGRIETFDGLQILKKNQEKEIENLEKEIENLEKERLKQQRKELSKKKKHLYFQVGINQFIPLTASITETSVGYVAKTGFSSKASYQVYINENFSYIPSIAFHSISLKDDFEPFTSEWNGELIVPNEYNRSILSIGNEIEYNIKNRFYVSSGVSFDFLFFNAFINPFSGLEDDLGYYSSFILNLKYILNQEGKIRCFIFSDSKIPFYYSNQKEYIEALDEQIKTFNLQLNTTISVGIGANF